MKPKLEDYYVKYVGSARLPTGIFGSLKKHDIWSVQIGKTGLPYLYGTYQQCWREAEFKGEYFGVDTHYEEEVK